MFLRSRAWPVRKTDNLAAICEPMSTQCANLDVSQPYKPPRRVTGIALLYGDGVCFL
jgi:hypothetical protein